MRALLTAVALALLAGLTCPAHAERIKDIDVVIELLDARLPGSSANPMLAELTGHKPGLKVLNKQVKGSRAEGIPYPGTILLDKDGVIRAKLFLEGYKDRHATDDLIKAARSIK